MNERQSQQSPARRPGVILALICLPVFIGALDLTIVSAVLPNVIVDLQIPFQTGIDDAAWMVSGYLLAYTVSVAAMGRISDIVGRRRTYFFALLIFILGSWLVATAVYAPTDWMRRIFRLLQGGRPDTASMSLYALIAGRVIQALGAGAMVPVSMALVGDLYPPARRATALGVVGAVDTAGWVLGSLYGGLMVQAVDWPVLFWINIPVTAAIAIITWRQLEPISQQHGEGGLTTTGLAAVAAGGGLVTILSLIEIVRGVAPGFLETFASRLLGLNWLSAVIALLLLLAAGLTLGASQRIAGRASPNWPAALLMTLALVGLNIGLGGGEGETTSTLSEIVPLKPFNIALLIVAALALAAYIIIERRSTHPIFPLTYFRDRNLSLAVCINLVVGFCLMAGLVSVPLFVNTVIAQTPNEGALISGLLLGTLTIPMAVASVPGGMLTRRVGYRLPTVLGLGLAAVGFSLGTTWTVDVSRLTMGWHMALAGIGLGLTVAPVSTAVLNAVSESELGIASAVVLIMRLIGMTLSTSSMTRYGLRRSTILTESMVSTLEGTPDFNALVAIGVEVATRVINEILLIAAIMVLVAVIPALFFSSSKTQAAGD